MRLGTLTIDGRPVRTATVSLSKGDHRIEYAGPPGRLELLWLPGDGRQWQPRRDLQPTFSRLF